DTAPTVNTTTPTNGATGVANNTNIVIDFSESVTTSIGWFNVTCGTSGNVTSDYTNTPGTATTHTLTYTGSGLSAGETCTVTINATNVTDADTDDPPDNMAADYVFNFTVATPVVFDLIHDIQGSGAAVTGSGPFTVEAVVIADYQNSNQLRGFFIQEEDADADADLTTSEGIFVYCNSCPVDVNVGDLVQVTGTASEYFNMSQLSATGAGDITIVSNGNTLPSPATININTGLVSPAGNKDSFYEPFEGMRVTINDTLTVSESEYFELFLYGQVVLYEGGRPYQYTHIDNTPTAGEYTTHQDDLARRRIILDDGSTTQNLALSITPQILFYPYPNGFGVGSQGANFFRGGDTITNLTGVLHYSFNEWRIQPTESSYTFTPVNTRPTTPPNPGGNVRVSSFNVLNYFTTIDTTSSNSSGSCGPSGTLDCRGADSNVELTRQTDKLVQALNTIDADVFGLIEIENNINALTSLVNSLNTVAGAGVYDYVNVGSYVGTDAIMVALIYKPGTVTPIGAPLIDNDPVYSRPPVAQLFEVTDPGNPDYGERFIVVVNHFKSKGCGGASGADADQGDGQGCYNATRTNQATRLNDWLNNTVIPTYGDPDVLIIGDLNAYKGEDPITTLRNAGYTDLTEAFAGNNAYSYVFSGQLGYLDHALGNASMTAQVTGVADWHINADEVPVFDYNDDVRDTGEASFEEEPDGNPLYEANPFRTSDHDPVLIGLDLNSTVPVVISTVDINGVPLNGTTLNTVVDQLRITFNIAVFDDGTGADPDSVSNPGNYILLAEGSTPGFQTVDCAGGVNAGDVQITQTSTVYNASTNTTTLSFSPALTNGVYRLHICGTTSIVSASNPTIALNG
ncbi:MAG: ExeM/NucH family extracellular endonuclease, partial [Chloroflexi bacterium]